MSQGGQCHRRRLHFALAPRCDLMLVPLKSCPRKRDRDWEAQEAVKRLKALQETSSSGEALASTCATNLSTQQGLDADLAALKAKTDKAPKSHLRLGLDLGTAGVVKKGTPVPAVMLKAG